MAQPLDAPLPPNANLEAGYVVRIDALDPTTGAQVTGVTVTDFTIFCDNVTGGNLASGAFQVVNPVLVRQAQV